MGENIECRITVTNDVLPGKIDFASPTISAKQTDEEIVVKITRSQFTEGNFEIIFGRLISLSICCSSEIILDITVLK